MNQRQYNKICQGLKYAYPTTEVQELIKLIPKPEAVPGDLYLDRERRMWVCVEPADSFRYSTLGTNLYTFLPDQVSDRVRIHGLFHVGRMELK